MFDAHTHTGTHRIHLYAQEHCTYTFASRRHWNAFYEYTHTIKEKIYQILHSESLSRYAEMYTWIVRTAVLVQMEKPTIRFYFHRILSLVLVHSLALHIHTHTHTHIYVHPHAYIHNYIQIVFTVLGYTVVAASNAVLLSFFAMLLLLLLFVRMCACILFCFYPSILLFVSFQVSRPRSKESGTGNLDNMLISFTSIVHAIHEQRDGSRSILIDISITSIEHELVRKGKVTVNLYPMQVFEWKWKVCYTLSVCCTAYTALPSPSFSFCFSPFIYVPCVRVRVCACNARGGFSLVYYY